MIAIVAGALVVIWAFVWMAICANAGWSDAWWYFDWAQCKFLLLVQLLVGGLLIVLWFSGNVTPVVLE